MNVMNEKKDNAKSPGDRVMGEADRWFARLTDPNCPQADRMAFERWRAGSREHARAYARVERLWSMGDEAIRGDPALMAASERALHPATPPRLRRRWVPGVVAAAALLVLAMVLVPGWVRHHQEPAGTAYATTVGQQRTITLADGSTLVLDTDTRLRVRYNATTRRVDLLRGRAQFHVQHNRQRPFVVYVPGGTVTDIGTTFQVGLDDDEANVVLLDGHVVVASHAGDKSWRAALQPGHQLVIDRDGGIGRKRPVDMARARGWTSGELLVDDWTLPRLLDAMNRYSDAKVVIGDASLRQLRISGVFRAGDQKTLVAFLERGWSIRATQEAPDRVILSACD